MQVSLKDAKVAAALSGATVAYPERGALRVHREPWSVYQPQALPHGAPQQRGPNRFDDPHHHYPVRYLGEHLSTCLLEVLARFRGNDAADDLLKAMTPGLDDPDLGDLVDPEQAQGVSDFLAESQVGLFKPPPSAPLDRLVDVFDQRLLAALDNNHRIRHELSRSDVVAAFQDEKGSVHLDGSLIRNANSKVGRPVTQEVSFLLFDVLGVQGLRYYSRHADGDEAICWAIRGDVRLDMKSAEYLDPANDEHRAAVQLVSDLYELPLPVAWSTPVQDVAR